MVAHAVTHTKHERAVLDLSGHLLRNIAAGTGMIIREFEFERKEYAMTEVAQDLHDRYDRAVKRLYPALANAICDAYTNKRAAGAAGEEFYRLANQKAAAIVNMANELMSAAMDCKNEIPIE